MVNPTQSAVNAALMAAVGSLMDQVNTMNASLEVQHQNHNNNQGQGNHYTAIASQIARSRAKTYDGTVDPVQLSEWFRDMEKQFTLFRVEDGDKVDIAAHFLEKDADRMVGYGKAYNHCYSWIRLGGLQDSRGEEVIPARA